MSDIGPIGRPNASTFGHGSSRVASSYSQPNTRPASRSEDAAEFSPTARLLSKLQELPDVRQDLVDRVRAEIAEGTYETPEKVDAAVAAIIAESQELG